MMRSIAFLMFGGALVLSPVAQAATMDSSVAAQSSAFTTGMATFYKYNDGSIDLALYAAGAYGGFSFDLAGGSNPAGNSAAPSADGTSAGNGPSSNPNGTSAEIMTPLTPTVSSSDSETTVIQAPIGGSGASNPSTVPLPGSAPMFGTALVALAVAGFKVKRRNASTAA